MKVTWIVLGMVLLFSSCQSLTKQEEITFQVIESGIFSDNRYVATTHKVDTSIIFEPKLINSTNTYEKFFGNSIGITFKALKDDPYTQEVIKTHCKIEYSKEPFKPNSEFYFEEKDVPIKVNTLYPFGITFTESKELSFNYIRLTVSYKDNIVIQEIFEAKQP
jgi:hypothetical protein